MGIAPVGGRHFSPGGVKALTELLDALLGQRNEEPPAVLGAPKPGASPAPVMAPKPDVSPVSLVPPRPAVFARFR